MISVKLKYYEEGSSWTEKSSLGTTAAAGTASGAAAKSVSVSIIDLSSGDLSAVDTESLIGSVAVSSPAFVFVHNATKATRQHMMQLSCVRKMYGITDFVRYESRENSDKGTVALVRVGVNCDVVENARKLLDSNIVRLFMTFQVRSFAGVSLTVAALHVDGASSLRQRQSVLTGALPRLAGAELVVFSSNLWTALAGASRSELGAELHTSCAGKGFVDAADEAGEKNSGGGNHNSGSANGGGGGGQSEWSAWVKSSRFAVTHFAREVFSFGGANKTPAAIASVTMAPRPAAPIAIPQPRSAKSANSRGSPASLPAPAIMTDPAILSAEAAGRGAARGGGVIERFLLQQQQHKQQQGPPRWRATHSYTLKNNEKLNSHETAFDISSHFSSVANAVEALNSNTIHWPADFCVVHNVILASDNVDQGDKRAMFRRYARDYKNSAALISQMFLPNEHNNNTNVDTFLPNAVQENTSWLKRVSAVSNTLNNDTNGDETAALLPASRAFRREEEFRNRSWDASWCTFLYEVTPCEMMFNITPAVGVGMDTLNRAIQCLNLRSQPKTKAPQGKENPLQNYAHDYALLFSTELQGYWLIAATHVPCDIVACRYAAKNFNKANDVTQ